MNVLQRFGWFRWVVLILGLLAIGFFSAGLINPTVEYKAEVEINHPRDTVWSLFHTDSLIDEWVTEVDSSALIRGNPGEPGAIYRMWIDSRAQKFVMDQELTAFRPPEFVAFHYDEFGMQKTDTFSFEDIGNKTRITGQFKVRADHYIHRCLYAFMGGYFKQIDQRYLDNFKQLAEQRL